MKLTKSRLKQIITEELELILKEGNKAAKTVGDPPYRERGATESQAQQKAAGMAYACRKKRGKERTKCAQKVKQHKSKEPKHLKSLPGHVTPAKD